MKTPGYVIFDWGNTVMRDLEYPGPMKDWPLIELIPGIEVVLEKLKQRSRLVIATSAPHSNTADMREALRRGGVEQYFTLFFSSFELGCRKPDPAFFRSLISELQCLPSEAISIGDKYPNDISAAKTAGLGTIWFNESRLKGSYPDADYTIYNMAQLTEIFT
ncbi:MAG TPA: HAD family hydrolase [Bacteroidales bacterium]|nr:HAD family hydrolase [Bacteroidales bacterium]HSA42732.1 HAD family hydrolase [Bacteroidales bacterium]